MILPQNGSELRLVLNNSTFIRFNDIQVDLETSYFQTLRDMNIILSYDHNDHNKTFIFDSESSGSIEVVPEYSCATINLRMFTLTMILLYTSIHCLMSFLSIRKSS